MKNYSKSTHEKESENILLLESGIQLKESGIPPTIGIRTDWHPKPGIQNPRRGIQNPRLSWIPLRIWGNIRKTRLEKRSVTFPNRPPA